MAKHSLTVLEDPSRLEFGKYRTVCDCRECTINCQHIPGYLIPSDLILIAKKTGQDVRNWAMENLLASPGALVVKDGVPFRVPTLVPARSKLGNEWCKFLVSVDSGDAKRFYCAIHDYSPFGCAFFDSHMQPEVAHELSAHGLAAIIVDMRDLGLYARIWIALDALGKRAPSPVLCRQSLEEAYLKELHDRVANKEPKDPAG